MPKTIVINSSNYVENSGNKYANTTFLRPVISMGSGIGVSISIYNSIQNITQKRGNNVVTLNWLGTDYIFTFPDGLLQCHAQISFCKISVFSTDFM
jgi:hypothetical protein